MKRKSFEGEYVRGGQNTLYMSREDVIQTLMLLISKHYSVRELMAEANMRLAEQQIAKTLRQPRSYYAPVTFTKPRE
jgi:hypothetical protein